jgi:hypothetical protein
MQRIIQFNISHKNGAYTAEGLNAPIVTSGDTFAQLSHNIHEAVDLFFRDERPEALGFAPFPSILANFELPTIAYGGQA